MTASFYARIFSKTRKMKVFFAVVVDEMIGDHFVKGLLCEFYKMILQKRVFGSLLLKIADKSSCGYWWIKEVGVMLMGMSLKIYFCRKQDGFYWYVFTVNLRLKRPVWIQSMKKIIETDPLWTTDPKSDFLPS